MDDNIGSGSVCFDPCHSAAQCNSVQLSAAEYVVYGCLMTINNCLSLNPNRCHHPLSNQLSFKLFFNLEAVAADPKIFVELALVHIKSIGS